MTSSRKLVVVALFLMGASGCAGLQSRVGWPSGASDAASQPSSPGWFSSRWWSRPTPTSASSAGGAAETPSPVGPETSTTRRATPETDIWSEPHTTSRLSRLFPLLGHRDSGKGSIPADGYGPADAQRGVSVGDNVSDRMVKPVAAFGIPSPPTPNPAAGSPIPPTDGAASEPGAPDLLPSPLPTTAPVKPHERPTALGDVALEVAPSELSDDDPLGERANQPGATRPRREVHLVPASAGAAELTAEGEDTQNAPAGAQKPGRSDLGPPPPPIERSPAPAPSQAPPKPAAPAATQRTAPAPRAPSTTTSPAGPPQSPLPAARPAPAAMTTPAPAQAIQAKTPEPAPTAVPGPPPATEAPKAATPASAPATATLVPAQAPAPQPENSGPSPAPDTGPAAAASGQTQAATAPQAFAAPAGKAVKSTHRRWSLVAWVHSLHAKEKAPTVLASPQLPAPMFPTSYQSCTHEPAPAGQPKVAPVLPSPQAVLVSAPAPCSGSALGPKPSCFSWVHKGMVLEFFHKTLGPGHGCTCPCHSSPLKILKKGCGPCSSPAGSGKCGGIAYPWASPQASPATPQSQPQTPPAPAAPVASESAEPRDVAETAQVFERIAAEGFDKTTER